MKYFTREIVDGEVGADEGTNWINLFFENEKRYYDQLKNLKPRLNVTTFKFFTSVSLHDSLLVSVKIVDKESEANLLDKKYRQRQYPTDVSILILHLHGKYLYDLEYSCVRNIDIDLPSDAKEPSICLPMDLGWWRYDELTAKDDKFMGHDILFHSGTILSLEFKSVKVKRRKK